MGIGPNSWILIHIAYKITSQEQLLSGTTTLWYGSTVMTASDSWS